VLRARVITAVLLLALVVPVVVVGSVRAWGVLTLVFMAIAAREWSRLLRPQQAAWPLALALTAVGILYLAWQPDEHMGPVSVALLAFAFAFWLLAAPWRLWRHDARPGGRVLAFLLLLACWLGLLQLRAIGVAALLVAMAIVWVADIAGYFVGRALGRNKLAPRISPGKSWEGAFGGVIAVALLGLGSAHLAWLSQALPSQLLLAWGPAAAIGCLVTLAALSIVGDLHESLLKRQAGAKDSGSSLPGHGGVLDRIDAMIATIPPVVLLHLLLR
jgi:phosphatidate cytidylyltransferase